MKPYFSYFFKILIIVAFFSGGIVIGVIINDLPRITFGEEISLIDVTNFILTLFLATYIPFFHNKTINNKRSEKDLLLKVCDKLEDEMKELKDMVDNEYVSGKNIRHDKANLILIKNKSIKKKTVQLVNNIKKYQKNAKTKNICLELKRNQVKYWEKLTPNIRSKKNKITTETYYEIESQYNAFINNLLQLKLQLNDS